jgi:DNA replication and repair protein RecF
LRLIRDGSARSSQLDFWDHELVEHGSYIAERRSDSVAELNVSVKSVHPLLTDDREFLRVDLQASICGGADTPAESSSEIRTIEEWKAAYRRRLEEIRSREIAQGVSLVGPHRDDLRFSIDGADTTTYGSRGQQRTAALSLKLGEAEFIQRRTGEQPILLLDDVTSELDLKRRRQVIHSIQPGQQVLVTCTDLEVFEPEFLEKSRIYRVKRGQVELAH